MQSRTEDDVVEIRDGLPTISRWPNQPRHQFDQSFEGSFKTLGRLMSDKNFQAIALLISASLIKIVRSICCRMMIVEALR